MAKDLVSMNPQGQIRIKIKCTSKKIPWTSYSVKNSQERFFSEKVTTVLFSHLMSENLGFAKRTNFNRSSIRVQWTHTSCHMIYLNHFSLNQDCSDVRTCGIRPSLYTLAWITLIIKGSYSKELCRKSKVKPPLSPPVLCCCASKRAAD